MRNIKRERGMNGGTIMTQRIGKEGVRAAIKRMKSGKAAGSEDTPVKDVMLKLSVDSSVLFFCGFFGVTTVCSV